MMYMFCQVILEASIILQAIGIGALIADKIDVKTQVAINKIGWILTLVYFILRW